jgi:S1-C subfamily serine protease
VRKLIAALLMTLTLAAPVAAQSVISVARKVNPSLVRVTHPIADSENIGICTGFVVSSLKGWVLTAAHCVPDDQPVYVWDHLAMVIKKDDMFALLKIPSGLYPPIYLSRWRYQRGEQVVAFGFGNDLPTVLPGYVVQTLDGDFGVSIPFPKGMSGGPVVNMQGRVIGMVQSTTPSVGLACGFNELRAFLNGAAIAQ